MYTLTIRVVILDKSRQVVFLWLIVVPQLCRVAVVSRLTHKLIYFILVLAQILLMLILSVGSHTHLLGYFVKAAESVLLLL